MEELAMRKSKLSLVEKLYIVWTFIARNARLWIRFRISFVMDILAMLAQASIFCFLGNSMMKDSLALAQHGGNYVSYVILGLAFSRFMEASLTGCYQSISNNYWSMRLEPILLSPPSVGLVVMSDVSWGYIRTCFDVTCYLLLGWAFGMQIGSDVNYGMAVVVLLLSILSVLGFGLMSGAMFMLINAKGWNDPIRWTIGTLQGLVSGVYFPISVLPGWLQKVSLSLPQTYAIDAARRVMLTQATIGETVPIHSLLPTSPLIADVLVLVIFTVILIPLGWLIFKLGLAKARRDGGLSRWT